MIIEAHSRGYRILILDSGDVPAVPRVIAPDKIVLEVRDHIITLSKEELNIIFRMSYGVDWELPGSATTGVKR